jgi:NADP-reducing hydrogenase subunit HndC
MPAWESPHSTGTKVFSLVGKVNNVGLVEVPMGVSMAVPSSNRSAAACRGANPSRRYKPAAHRAAAFPTHSRTLPVDFDSLTAAGSMMGSGAMIVMDDSDCVVDVARYFLRFLEEESCGKCLPCRLGLTRLREILDNFSKGVGSEQDITDLTSLSQAIQDGALCALGSSAPNPVLTTIRYFKEEYLAHVRDHKCPAGVCKDLIVPTPSIRSCAPAA